ncbi:CocE/NonD family hydrolase [Flavihumibacter sp. CACIAM 22H1]|uniref:CocE/NonD family hydrolase n=1 Tax=Flavihumibacter sp. CACIAM 22H1 TaxID=1812911 RepID=UPI0007A91E57|nr:CocE/NonD family hydrolase [Flavihumibacter sp. CACIAM 22H1]KYP16258.1 MAG: peptidase S15 [Flavihumibacter sp. CACIAM 22H1]
MSKLAASKLFFLILTSFTMAFGQDTVTAKQVYLMEDSVLIPTRSGIPLSAIIVRKKADKTPLPALLFYTTYYQGAGDAIFGKRSADREYVGIVAYARGIRTNLQYYQPFENEGTDIYDIIDWISRQPWCNGAVGMFGGSYTGFSQWAAVKKPHPALKTIVPQVAVMPGFDFPMENNVPLSHILSWSNDNIYKNKPLPRGLPFDYFNTGIAYNKLDSMAGVENPIFQKWLAHPAYDSYWQSKVPTSDEYALINLPILSTTGYYDGSQLSALQYFKWHTRYNKNADHYFVIGPYDHWGGQRNPTKNLMGYEIDSVASVNMMNLAYDWLDYVLKGKPKPALLKGKFNYQVMGANEWRHASSLDQISSDTLTFYLNNTKLDTRKPRKKNYQLQVVDFKDREHQNNYFTPSIVFDSLDVSNGLVFTSAPFQQELILSGSFTGSLLATINKKDMDVSMALYEWRADGSYFFLTRYVGRASFSRDNTRRQLLEPYRQETINFDRTRFVSKKINAGSRLVVLLNINKHPFEMINYGSGKPCAEETIHDAGEPLQIKWHNKSFIKIPVLRNSNP